MLYSRTCQHAIRALIAVAEQQNEHLCTVREISGATGVRRPVLAKVLSALARAGLLTSARGVGGGFQMARPPDEITLMDIVLAIEGTDAAAACALGFPVCSGNPACPLHPRWRTVRECIREYLCTTTLAEMVRTARVSRVGCGL